LPLSDGGLGCQAGPGQETRPATYEEEEQVMSEMTDREARAEETYARLFGPRDTSAADNDPEFGRILRTFIFGDVFRTGDLDDRFQGCGCC
ncbi:MAG TPA: hypothetical protein VG673_21175, partial [Actinomycetota bacterium]|nr:hypothetical protein [Actinomycetota bacterium]